MGAAFFMGTATHHIGPAFRQREEHFVAVGAQCLAAAQTIRNRLLA